MYQKKLVSGIGCAVLFEALQWTKMFAVIPLIFTWTNLVKVTQSWKAIFPEMTQEVLGRQRFFVCLEIQYELLDSPLTLFLQICKYHKSAYDSLSMHNRHRLESGVVHFMYYFLGMWYLFMQIKWTRDSKVMCFLSHWPRLCEHLTLKHFSIQLSKWRWRMKSLTASYLM